MAGCSNGFVSVWDVGGSQGAADSLQLLANTAAPPNLTTFN